MAKTVNIPVPSLGGITKPEEAGVELDLRDGKIREVRFSIRSVKWLKEHELTRDKWDDQHIPTLIWLGLHDDAGNPPADVTVELLEALPPHWLPYLGAVVVGAYHNAFPAPRAIPAADDESVKKNPIPTVQ